MAVDTSATTELDDQLTAARLATPLDRVEEHRDSIAALGVPAIEAISDWLSDPDLSRFALRVIGRAGKLGEPDAAIAALIRGRAIVPAPIQPEIDDELRGLRYEPPKPRKAKRPSWAKTNPYDVAPLPAGAGLSWPGFQPNEFGDVIGTTWRRRDDPGSLPPLILGALRQVHSHFSSWSIYRSAEVHFAITDRYQQFDQRESGWRAAKLVVYAHGPTGEQPSTTRQAVAGLYIEKGDGDERFGPVDARWDWPRFVTSLTDPATSQPLGAVLDRHGLQIGDFVGQRFGPETQVGGVGRMEDGEFVFRDYGNKELFRGFAELRHYLEQLPAERWHDMHVWRSWPADEAVKSGPSFASEALIPVLVDLARIYVGVVKDAMAQGIRALHRIVERRDGPNGPELVCVIQAHAQPGHLTLPRAVMDELGIPTDGRVRTTVESLEGETYQSGELWIRSGTEIYHRVNDDETKGLDKIDGKEWIRVTVSRPYAAS